MRRPLPIYIGPPQISRITTPAVAHIAPQCRFIQQEMLLDTSKYEEVCDRTKRFNEKGGGAAVITFIIPTINRDTLQRALQSLINQTVSNWRAIILFDGCEPTDSDLLSMLMNEERFLYVCINRHGSMKGDSEAHNSAGAVRNIGMRLVTTPWIGFLDDDDALASSYVECLLEEIEISPEADFVAFRMFNRGEIIPSAYITTFVREHIGISFCFKRYLFEEERLQFKQGEHEDFILVKQIQDAGKKMIISPHVAYFVRDVSILPYMRLGRIVIN